MADENAEKISRLNDIFRKTFIGGKVFLTEGVKQTEKASSIIEAVEKYEFHGIDDNNPYGENDFGAVTVDGEKYYFKIDYYDLNYECHSPDAADPKVTRRVLTIMRSDEY